MRGTRPRQGFARAPGLEALLRRSFLGLTRRQFWLMPLFARFSYWGGQAFQPAWGFWIQSPIACPRVNSRALSALEQLDSLVTGDSTLEKTPAVLGCHGLLHS